MGGFLHLRQFIKVSVVQSGRLIYGMLPVERQNGNLIAVVFCLFHCVEGSKSSFHPDKIPWNPSGPTALSLSFRNAFSNQLGG